MDGTWGIRPAWLSIHDDDGEPAGALLCTGGGLSADDTEPGPVFLQGDHTSVSYRNIVLEPVVRSD